MPIPILLDRSRAETLTEQLVAQFRSAIRKGAIRPGARLPSSRKLAEQLAISRNTVVRAYELLILESYAETKRASGVLARLPPTPHVETPNHPTIGHSWPAAPATARKAPNLVAEHRQRLSFDFFPGRPSAASFPLRAWRRHILSALSTGVQELSQYGDPAGCFDLRAAICSHVATTRGIVADPNQIMILNGAQEGVSLCARLFLSPGNVAIVENPSAQGVVYAFEAAGARIVSVPVDEYGMRTEDIPRGEASLIHIMPAHQFPTGCDLNMERRRALADWAGRSESYILEDDCAGDLRYNGDWLPAVASLAPDITLYLGSFSKTLGAGLRLGYLIVPRHLVECVRASKALLNNGTNWLQQAALAEFMTRGAYATHVARLRTSYCLSRDILVSALSRHFGDVELGGDSGGLHLLWRLPPGVPPAPTFEALAKRVRVGIYSFGSAGAWEPTGSSLARRSVLLGFGSLNARQIEDGIARLSDLVDDRLDRHHDFLGELLPPEPSGLHFSSPVGSFSRPVPSIARELVLHGARDRRPVSSRIRREEKGRAMFVTGIYRYPVKGLSAEALRGVDLIAGRPFPFDRVFALARPNTTIDPDNPRWAKKALFLMLMLEERLARASTTLDPKTLRMTIALDGRTIVTAPLDTVEGRAELEKLLGELARPQDPLPKLVRSREGHFMDKPDNVLSLINLATIRELEGRWGVTLDPLRFRANLYVDGLDPWEEFEWVGRDIRIGDAILFADRRNGRCGATNVNPQTGERDRDIPGNLRATFGHKDLGIYLLTKVGGKIVIGDPVLASDGATSELSKSHGLFSIEHAPQYICRGCYYIYDEAAGASQSGTQPGTAFDALPSDWSCPDCGTDKGKFRPYQVRGSENQRTISPAGRYTVEA